MKTSRQNDGLRHLLTLMLVLVLLLSALPAHASGGGGGGGGGGGQGGGQNEPLQLVASVPEVGADLAADFVVELEFNKNVVDASVREGNLNCFSLYDAVGNELAVLVEMGDEQIDPDAKNFITVKSADSLESGTYELVVSGDLESRSGNTLGEELRLQYTVSAGAGSGAAAPETPESAATSDNTRTIVLVLIVVVALALVVYIVMKQRKKK